MHSKRRFSIEKLVRDNIENFLTNQGITTNARTLSKNELIAALKNKLVEEAQEVSETTNIEGLIEELADVMEVINSLMQITKIEANSVEERRLSKKERAGGFANARYFHFVDVPSDSPKLQYYLDRSRQYPELVFLDDTA